MSSQPPTDVPPDLRDAMEALSRDPASARDTARAALAGPAPDPRYWVVLGHACSALDDWQGVEAAADGMLAAAPNAILGLIWKADCFSKLGELRNASAHYTAAMRAAQNAGPLPEPTQRDLERVEREIEEIRRTYAWHLDAELKQKGISADNSSRAFAETFATLAGTHHPDIKLQRPHMVFYPGLPQRAFYEREEFDWVAGIEAATDAIRAELDRVLADAAEFLPFVEGAGADAAQLGVAQEDDRLSAYALWESGQPVADHIARCPNTADALETVPRPRFPGRCPIAAYWRLAADTLVPARHGMLNSRLIGHLPLIAPPRSGLSVDGEWRDWEPGKLVIFDDSVEHEIRNESGEDAVVLLFDIARPEIDAADQAALAALFEAVDSFR